MRPVTLLLLVNTEKDLPPRVEYWITDTKVLPMLGTRIPDTFFLNECPFLVDNHWLCLVRSRLRIKQGSPSLAVGPE